MKKIIIKSIKKAVYNFQIERIHQDNKRNKPLYRHKYFMHLTI